MINKRNVKYGISLFLIIIISTLLSCATNTYVFREIDLAVEIADYLTAVEEIKRGQERTVAIYSEKNAIQLFLDKGLLEHYSKNYEDSSEDLQNAERLIEEAYTKSISEGFMSYIINDNVKEYPGEDFEDIYINVFNALNYFHRGNYEGALVEIRKLSLSGGKLDMLGRKYEYIDPITGRGLNEMVKRETGISQMPETRSANFSNSALARYLGALFYQAVGNVDSARIEFDQVERAFRTNSNIYSHPIPNTVQQTRSTPIEETRLNIISFTGLSPIKEEAIILQYLPFRHPVLQVAMFRLPELVSRSNQITRIEVIVEGAGKFDLELLEDIGAVIRETFLTRYSNILTKTYIRTIIKYAVADVVAMETARQKDNISGLLIALAARAGMDVSEGADIRMSRYLPDKAHIGGINLDPGEYSVIINYYNGGRLISAELREITVKTGSLNLLQTVKLR